MEYQPRGFLVTGAAGFVGSHVALALADAYPECPIVSIDRLDYCASLRNLDALQGRSNHTFVRGDVADRALLTSLFKDDRLDTVLHFAAHTHVDNSFVSSLDFTVNNVVGTQVLADAARAAHVRRFIHVSSDEVYGGASDEAVPFTEDSPLRPTNPYAASKAAAEHVVLSYWRSFQFPVVVARGNNVYGPHQYPEKVIPRYVAGLLRHEKCNEQRGLRRSASGAAASVGLSNGVELMLDPNHSPVHGDGSSVRNFMYVSDAVEAFLALLRRGQVGEVYNIGSDVAFTTLDLARRLVRLVRGDGVDERQWIEHAPDRAINDHRYPIDSSKILALGWRPCVPWAEGIRRTVDWYRSHAENHWT